MQSIALLSLTVVLAETVQPNRFVTAVGAVPAAGANVLGVVQYGGVAGDAVPVDSLGTAVAEAGAAIAAGDALEVDSAGRAIPLTTGAPVARALQAASGAGRLLEVHLIPN